MRFHLNGYKSGDPDIAEAQGTRSDTLPTEVDVLIVGCGPAGLKRWSRDIGPVVKVDQLVKEMIQNDETKEPFTRFQGQGCA